MNRTTTIRTTLAAAIAAVALPAIAFADPNNAEDDNGQVVITAGTQDTTGKDGQESRAAARDDEEAQVRDRGPLDTDRQARAGQMRGQDGADPILVTLTEQELTKWFEYTASANQYEVEAAKLAQQKVQDPEIKQLAQTVERDHGQALEKLRQEAEDAGVKIASTPELKDVHQAALDALRQKEGEDFKKAYVFSQDSGHRLAILEHSWAKTNVENPQVLAYVDAVLPKLQQHHRKVHEDARRIASLGEEYQSELNGQARMAGDRQGGQASGFEFSSDPAEGYYQRRSRDLMYESELNRMAVERGQNPQIKAYAQREQQRAQDEMRQIEQDAQQAGFDVSGQQVGMSPSQQGRIDEMRGMNGRDFDREYVFETSRQSFSRGLQDSYATRNPQMGQNPAGQQAMQSAQRSMQGNAQRQQELQELLIIVVEPQQGQPGGQQGQQGQQGQPGMNGR